MDTVEDKSVVAIRPKPAFRPIFEVATTRAGSGIVLVNETPPDPEGPEAESLCSWWRRGRVELLAHPPWRTHSVTFPKPWGSSPTLLTVIRVHSALSCLMAEGHELGTRKLAQSRTIPRTRAGGVGGVVSAVASVATNTAFCLKRYAIRQSDSLQGTTFSLLLTCRDRNGQRLRGIVPHRRFLNVDSSHRWGITVGLL